MAGPADRPRRRSDSSPAAAGFVDAQVAPFAHRIRPSGVDRLVEEAIVRFMPAEARRRREAADDGRHAHVHTHQVSFEGTVWVEAEVDLADALDLDTALSVGAARLADLGSTASLDVRRSEALGEMARHQLSLDLDTTPSQRDVVLHVHVSEDAITTPDSRLHLARVANTRSFVDADQVRAWCGAPGTTVTVKPVVDLAEHLHVDQYQVPDRLAAQATERDLTCVFPWCTRPAEACDLDHAIPYSEGGPTASDNLGPLCRRHHRLKTHHAGWGYTVLEPGSYLWSLTARLPVPARPPRHHRRHPRPATAHRPTSSDPAPHPAPATRSGGVGTPRRPHRLLC